MFKKEKIKEFLDFKFLITESVLKYLFIALGGLAIISTVFVILASWAGAFSIMRYSFGTFLMTFIGAPVVGIIVLVLYLLLLRLGFESILVRFLTYREVKQINDKTKDDEFGI